MKLTEKEMEEKRKEQLDIQTYFKFHPKKGDKLKPDLIKINKQITQEIAESILEKYQT